MRGDEARVAATEFDAVDLVLFETLQWIADQEQNFSLWSEPALVRKFRVTEMPVYFIRREETGAPVKAYLINFRVPPTGAEEVSHNFSGLGIVHRYDEEMDKLSATASFDFDLDLSGRPTYAVAYKQHNMDRAPLTNTSIPYTPLDVWVATFVHEGFHHYQFHAPDSDWLSLAWGGLLTADYPVTADNIALSLLERHALMDGRDAATNEDQEKVLLRVLAIRHTRTQLPEATPDSHQISATTKNHGQRTAAPGGIGQSFTACESGNIHSLRVDVIGLDSPSARLKLQTGTVFSPEGHSQEVMLTRGENVITLNDPFPVEAGSVYSFGIFPSTGYLSLWSATESYTGGEAFFIRDSSTVAITPAPSLTFELMIVGPNYIDRMDRYQERNEGSAEHVSRRLAVLSGNTVYTQEMLEMLERSTRTDHQTSRDALMKMTFQGGWYQIGSTILDLVDGVTDMNWRTTFPDGGSPIEVLETLYGPLTQQEIDQLVEDAKQAYSWEAIVDQVAAIPIEYLDSTP